MLPKCLRPAADFFNTVILWIYYIFGFIFLFSPFYIATYFFSTNREAAFQHLNHILHRSFFSLLKLLVCGLEIRIQKEARSLRSSVILCNHLSFLDPLLFVSIFEKQKTIVRSDFFSYFVFGWILKVSGYLPSATGGELTDLMIGRIEGMKDYLASGGNLFVFPEGTRSRDGRIGPLDKGAFRIAKMCKAPIRVLFLRNTNTLYPPDRFLFNTCDPVAIDVKIIGSIAPDYESDSFSMLSLVEQVKAMLEKENASCGNASAAISCIDSLNAKDDDRVCKGGDA